MTTTMTRILDILAPIAFVASMAFISVASPALYVALMLVAALIAIAVVSYVAMKELLGSDCPIDNLIGLHVVMCVLSALTNASE